MGSCQLHVPCSACFGINIPLCATRNGNPLHNTCRIGSICVWQINAATYFVARPNRCVPHRCSEDWLCFA